VRRVAEFKDAYRPVLRNDDVVETRKYELLTPLIGAGSSPFINDLQMPIRGGSIRGVLRFWWRATCGNRFGNLDDLRKAETAIWGSTDEASIVDVFVEVKPICSTELKPTHRGKNKPDGTVVPAYVSWPLNPSEENPNDIKKVLPKLQFTLTLRYPRYFDGRNLEEELNLALWAFEFFGGVGSRTRRGAGAVCRVTEEEKDRPYYTKNDVEWGWRYIKSGSWPDGVPHLNTEWKARLVEVDWSQMAKSHKSFFSEHFSKYMRKNNLKETKLKRVALGAPFEWKHSKVHDRLASPVIYRPLRLREGNFFIVVALRNLGSKAPKANPALVKEFFSSLGGNR